VPKDLLFTIELSDLGIENGKEDQTSNLQSWNNVAAHFQPEISYHFTENHKLTTRTVIDNQECVENNAVVFAHTVTELTRNDPSIQLVNTDQSGIELEIHSGRTLDFKGVIKFKQSHNRSMPRRTPS